MNKKKISFFPLAFESRYFCKTNKNKKKYTQQKKSNFYEPSNKILKEVLMCSEGTRLEREENSEKMLIHAQKF